MPTEVRSAGSAEPGGAKTGSAADGSESPAEIPIETPSHHPAACRVPRAFETNRLLIRCPTAEDAGELNAAHAESIEALRSWMDWAASVPTIEESRAFCARSRQEFLEGRDFMLMLFLKGASTFVGGSGLHRIDWSVPRFEIGYWVRSRFAGQGFITEAVRGISAVAFHTLDAQRVEIRCDSRNTNSRRAAERAGFPLEATLRNYARDVQGGLRDTLVFSLIPSEFEALQAADPTHFRFRITEPGE
jgi:RimJ/RimL family protein N-acetyltransferase